MGKCYITQMPFPTSFKFSIFRNIHSNGKRRCTCINTHKNTHVPISSSILHRKESTKRSARGKGDFSSQISEFCKIWPITYRGTMLFNIASLARKLFVPTFPQNLNDIEKILHCSICQCIGVYPVSCPTDKQMYILMRPGM